VVEFLKIMTNNPHLTYLDESSIMLVFATQLFLLNRPLMRADLSNLLEKSREKCPVLKLSKFSKGPKVFDWEVPQEWELREAFIKHKSGQRFTFFKTRMI